LPQRVLDRASEIFMRDAIPLFDQP
jgi:hypothetical protein